MTSTSQTLAERIASGRIPVMEALRIGTLLADQLRRLHEQGATHGALTPSMVAVIDNSVQLLFAAEPADSITPYTAPELLEGEPADPRSDIFAFGALLYEMVTGRRAFPGASPASIIGAIMRGEIPHGVDVRTNHSEVQSLGVNVKDPA